MTDSKTVLEMLDTEALPDTADWTVIPDMGAMYFIRSIDGRVEIKSWRSNANKKRGIQCQRPYLLKGKTGKTGPDKGRRFFNLRHPDGRYERRSAATWLLRTFVGQAPKGKPWALHRNGDHTDDRIGNVYWGSAADNARDAVRHGTRNTNAKVDAFLVHSIRTAGANVSNAELSRRHGICVRQVHGIRTGKKWASHPTAPQRYVRGKGWIK